MADAIKTKLQKVSGEYSAKVKDIRDLRAKKKEPFITDAEVKTINEQIRVLERESKAAMAELNRLTELEKTAKEYIKINENIKTLNSNLATAERRGEDTASIKRDINKATTRLRVIGPEVERSFPEIKVAPPKISTTTEAKGGPTGPAGPTGAPAVLPSSQVKAETTLKSKTNNGVSSNVTSDEAALDLAKKEAAKTKALGTISSQNVVTSDYAERNAGIAASETKTPLDTLLAKTEFWYDLPDYIFKLEPKLGELLVEAVDNDWDPAKFLAKAKLTPWWQKNASTVRERIVDRAKYDELKAAGEDVSKSDYGLYLSKQMRSVKAKAKEIAGVTLTDEQAQSVAQKIYDGFLDDDPLAINALITPFIGKTTSIVGTGTKQTGFGGQALQNYQTLQGIAKANGFSIKDILPNVSAITAGGDIETAVLRGLADGSIDINRVAQDARMLASQGQPKYVRDLLSQGYDLEAVYAPYRRTMANVLEIEPDEIDLNDSTLRMAITDKGDMNLFDFKKALRQDSRWQYTSDAREKVSSAALGVLRDFGFQG
jgi:hypothetical protein